MTCPVIETEASASLLPVELLVRLGMRIEGLPKPISRAEAVRAFVNSSLDVIADATGAV